VEALPPTRGGDNLGGVSTFLFPSLEGRGEGEGEMVFCILFKSPSHKGRGDSIPHLIGNCSHW